VTLVRFDVAGDVGTITLNRPDKLNALSNELARELVDALKSAASEHRVRALVITGAGRAFSAGGDVDRMRQLVDTEEWSVARDLLVAGADVACLLMSMPKPTIASVNGPAAGAGGSLALACDVRIASESASFGLVFSRLGLLPDWGATYFLPRIVGAARAIEIVAGGELIDAADAYRIGVFNRVVPGDQLEAATRELAARLAAKSPTGVLLARQAIYDSFELSLKDMLDREIDDQLRRFRTADAREGIHAFLEKRRASFSGE
jgi:2-(1,2-epoxy-1,2-dihydrophenyl)acetyl-CoA isomerase